MSHYPYFFTLKCHLHDIYTEFFPRSLENNKIFIHRADTWKKKFWFASIIVTAIILDMSIKFLIKQLIVMILYLEKPY